MNLTGSNQRKVQTGQGGIIPLSEEFLTLLYKEVILRPGTTCEDFLELESMRFAAEKNGQTTAMAERKLNAFACRLLNTVAVKETLRAHSSIYGTYFQRVCEMVYSIEVEPWEKWNKLAEDIDRVQHRLYPQEYEFLAGLLSWHSTEISNASLMEQGMQPSLLNVHARNYVSYEKLKDELLQASHEGSWSVAVCSAVLARITYCITIGEMLQFLTGDQSLNLSELVRRANRGRQFSC